MPNKPEICLVMPVRDEASIIERCLLSVRDNIDRWLIADTGSTDDTVGKVKALLKDIPGEIISLPWTDFATVRNELRERSRGLSDYVLWLDADETIEFAGDEPFANLDEPGYGLVVETTRGSFLQWRLARDDSMYCYAGPVSEALVGPKQIPCLETASITHHEDGFRWHDAAKNQRDMLILKSAMIEAPRNPSLILALADCHAARGELAEALHYYRMRADLKGPEVQTWYAMYQAARMLDEMGVETGKIVEAYHKAYDFRPGKIEPLVRIARHCRTAGQWNTALEISLAALETEEQDREYFFEPQAWNEQRYLEYLQVNLAIDCYGQVIDASEHLMSRGDLPLTAQKRVAALREQALSKRQKHPDKERKPGDNIPGQKQASPPPRLSYEPGEVPEATPRREKRKLCIGMSTYDDYDGVYFSVQAIRMYHPEILDEVEILVIDNNPTGPAAPCLKKLDGHIDNFRYVPETEVVGTTIRDKIFREANADYVLVMDCHVFIVPGALKRLLDYLDADPGTNDFIQGPLVYDSLVAFSTHFAPGWRGGMWGTWATDDRAQDPEAEPFDIPMQGLGLFACRRDAWPGFNPRFRSFGGEEGYIHEKIRQAGGRTLCVPFLRWMHRFNRPLGVPYPIDWASRVRNYLIGWHELGLDLDSIREHFSEMLGKEQCDRVFERVEREMQGPLFGFDGIYFCAGSGSGDDAEKTSISFEKLCIADRVVRPTTPEGCPDPESGKVLTFRTIVENARNDGLGSVLVIEDPAGIANYSVETLAEQAQPLLSGDCDWFILDRCSSEGSGGGQTAAIAVHRRVFDQLLEAIPTEPGELTAWLGRQGTLERYLRTVTTG